MSKAEELATEIQRHVGVDSPEVVGQGTTPIGAMCDILKKNLIVADEYTDCAIVYKVTFDQLRNLYDQGRAAPTEPSKPEQADAPSEDREEIEAVIACLGDDAAQLRDENPEDERADNMDKAADLLGRLLATTPPASAAVERELFEAEFPIPDGMVYWDGDKYGVLPAYENSYRADRYCGQWFAWQARAALASKPLPEQVAQDKIDAERWQQVRSHWKNAKFTFRKTPKNTVKTITLLIDFDHTTTCGANDLERELDAARTRGEGSGT